MKSQHVAKQEGKKKAKELDLNFLSYSGGRISKRQGESNLTSGCQVLAKDNT